MNMKATTDKNNECLGVNILPQITGNCISELQDFLGEHARRPPRLDLLLPAGANKRETPTSNLTESTAY